VHRDGTPVPATVTGDQDLTGADQADRDDGRTGAQRKSRHAGVELVQAPVRSARALRIDTEGLAVREQVHTRLDRGRRGTGVGAVDRDVAEFPEQARDEPSA
jgi:hypothetical protein